jgi:UDP:flavonoid glycosyltransferase YjiC (YdhE family)
MPGAIAFLSDAFPSHVYAALGLARRLERTGARVQFWGAPAIASLLRSQGVETRSIEGLISRAPGQLYHRTHRLRQMPRFAFRELRARRRFAREMPALIDASCRSLSELLAREKPDLAVFDPFLLAYYPLFWAAGVAGAALCPTPLLDRDPDVPPASSPVVPAKEGGGRVRAAWAKREAAHGGALLLARAAGALGGYTHDQLLAELARRADFPLAERRVERFSAFDLRLRGMPEWALTTPDLELPRRDPLPERLRFVGPCVDTDRREPTPPPPSGKRRVYVSVGTIEQMSGGDADFLARVIEALAPLTDLEVLVAAGSAATVAALGRTPPHVRVEALQPQLALLATASLTITHGGAGTIRESIVSGVPLLVFPRNDDQFGGATRVVFHGLGLAGDRLRATPIAIRAQIGVVLGDPAYRDRAARARDQALRFQAAVDFPALVGEAVALGRASAD